MSRSALVCLLLLLIAGCADVAENGQPVAPVSIPEANGRPVKLGYGAARVVEKSRIEHFTCRRGKLVVQELDELRARLTCL